MSDEAHTDEQREEMTPKGGARISIRDARVSKALAWIWAALGAGLLWAVSLAANNLYQLNLTVARGIDADASRDSRLNDHELRLRQMERDVSTLEGKVYRGIDGYETPVTPRGSRGR